MFTMVKDTATPVFLPYSATAPGPHDVWVIGTGLTNAPAARHWDGTSWQVVALPATGAGSALLAISGDNSDDVWAVGQSAGESGSRIQVLVEHFDGSTWSIVPAPSGLGSAHLSGVDAVSPTDVWAVGEDSAYPDGNAFGSLVEHYDGAAWTVVPAPHIATGPVLQAISAAPDGSVWAAGYAWRDDGARDVPIIERYDGTAFHTAPAPIVSNGQFIAIAALSATDVWALGNNTSSHQQEPLIEHYDGSSWTIVATPQLSNTVVYGMTAVSAADIWVDGTQPGGRNLVRPVVLHWDGTAWTTVPTAYDPNGQYRRMTAITHSRSRVWILGYDQDFDQSVHNVAEERCP